MEKDLDKKLYNDYLNGDEEAFELLYTRYKKRIEYFIYNIVKDYQKAEDLTQETFIYAMQNKMKENCRFKYYIYLIARSKAFNYITVEKRRNEISELYLAEDKEQVEKDVLEIIEKEETKKEILEAISLLDEKYKNAVYLTNIEGLSYEETSQILEETLSNTKTLIHRGKKQLRKILLEKGFEEMNKVSKVVIIIVCTGVLLSGVVFAKDISNFIKNFFGANSSDGVDTAVNNGFVSKVDSEPQSAEGIEVSIESFMMDDYNFAMNFSVILDDRYNVEEFGSSTNWLEDLRITDENDNVVFSTNYEFNEETGKPEYLNGYSINPTIIGEKQIRVALTSSGGITSFPRSKKLNIKFTRVSEHREGDINKVYIGDYNFEVDVPEEMYNRETVIYKVKNCNDNKTIVEDATLSNTAFKISIPLTTTDKIDYKALFDRENMTSIYSLIALQKEYVETSDGKKFETAQRSDGDGGYSSSSSENKITNYHQTFNLTKYDATDELKVHIFTNTGEEIVIEFEKSK